jgi:class 3 adenylate cyclase/predicted ATPase
MTVDELLAQVLDLLQRQGRVSYRALKRRFALDDEYLEDLKVELIDARRVAIDEEGKVLVWTGAAGIPLVPAQPPPRLAQPPVTREDRSAQVEFPLAEPHTTAAERRRLTVLFCDLVDSTALASQLDPEEWREVLRVYQAACAEVIQRFEGYIAQYLGDGLLVYFGYPRAHEDDVQRAVRAGLSMVEAIGRLNTRLKRDKALHLAVRVGMHTGLVVVGAIGGQGRQEQLALGDAPNIAARLQGLAAPNTVAISDATYRLVQGYFTAEILGPQALKGVASPVQVYRVLGASGAQSRLDVVTPQGLTPLVGREQEVALLLERWAQATAGMGQVVVLSGEAGIGKSRLVQVLKDRVAGTAHTRWECRGLPYYQNTAFYPVTELFQRALRWQPDDTPAAKLHKLETTLSQHHLALEEAVPLFADFLGLPLPAERYPPLTMPQERQRRKTLESLVALVLELAARQPCLFIMEDLHWVDPSTLELLTLLIAQVPTAALYIVLTCRPEFQPPWGSLTHVTPLALQRFSRPQSVQMVEHITGGKPLPPKVLAQIVAKADRVPLFVEELTKMVLESDWLREAEDRYALTGPLPPLAIPPTLHDALMARLDRLVTAKGVAQLAATMGRQFSYAPLQAVALLDDAPLQRELGRLVEAELLYQQGVPPRATYLFKHALIQETAYQSLLKSTRQQYHQQIAQVFEDRFPEMRETQPELLAHHYTEAGLVERALLYWQSAGQRAIQRSAHVEAIGHLTRGLALLETLPNTPKRTQQELALQVALGPALMATNGYAAPDVERAYARARELCQRIGETPQLFPVLRGLWGFYVTRGELETAHELGEQLLRIAQQVEDPALLLEARRVLGATLSYVGEFAAGLAHLTQSMPLYDPQQHRSHTVPYGQDSGVICLTYMAVVLWYLGYPEQALRRSQEALALAREVMHPFSLGFALNFAGALYQFLRDGPAVQERAEAAMALASEQGFILWLVQGKVLRGWALADQGQGAEGIVQMRDGLAAWRATGAELGRPYYLALLAEGCANMGQIDEGLSALAEALAAMHKHGEWYCAAELYRLKGELLLARSAGHHAEVQACFDQALEVARRQQAKSLELRVALSLARLWRSQGKRKQARQLLADIYSWFTEGFDAADLREAKALLEELS